MSRNDARSEMLLTIITRRRTTVMLALILSGLATLYLGLGFYRLVLKQNDPLAATDFRLRWTAQHYFVRHINPYDALVVTADSAAGASLRTAARPILPEVGPVRSVGYPPYAFVYGLLTAPTLPWPLARLWFSLLNLASLGLVGWWAYRLIGRQAPQLGWLAISSSMAIVANSFSLSGGQYSIVVTGLLAASWLALTSARQGLAGSLWGLAMLKPQIAAPYFLIFIVQRRYRAALAGVLVVLVSTVVASMWVKATPWHILGQMWSEDQRWAGAFGYGPLQWLVLAGVSPSLAAPLVAIPCVATAWFLMARHSGSASVLLVLATGFGRTWTYHGQADNTMLTFMLIPLLVLAACTKNPMLAAAFTVTGLTVWLPLTSAAHNHWLVAVAHFSAWLFSMIVVLRLAEAELQKASAAPASSPRRSIGKDSVVRGS